MIKRLKSLLKAIAGFLRIRLIDPIEVFYLPGENTFYPIISKSACSSIKLMLIKQFRSDFESDFPEIHHIDPAQITDNQLQRIYFYKISAYEKWASGKNMVFIMREPISRFYACYRDVKSGKNTMYYQPAGLEWLIEFRPGLSLDTFLKKVASHRDAFSDRHFRSQSFYLSNPIRQTAGSINLYSLSGFMTMLKTDSQKPKVERLNTTATSISTELKTKIGKNPLFKKRFNSDILLYSEIINQE